MTDRQLHKDTIEIAVRANRDSCKIVLETLEGNKVPAWKNMEIICNKTLSFLADPKSNQLEYDQWLDELNQLLSMLDEARKLL